MLLLAVAVAASGAAAAKVPAMYVFGDSTADVGNNDYLPWSIAKADFPHNGVDFPGGSTDNCNANTVTVLSHYFVCTHLRNNAAKGLISLQQISDRKKKL
jgi:phospholipase/lecithinase/hemolysin